ncbi:MAG: hypothetical protein ACK4TK_00830, partial [Thiobacillaceae bacterium]
MSIPKDRLPLVSQTRICVMAGAVACLLATSTAAQTISQVPIYLPTPLAPNIVLTFDDSGSMAWAAVPDSIAQWGDDNT